MSKRKTFKSTFTRKVHVTVHLETDKDDNEEYEYLIAYLDDEMQDGMDYSEYEERLKSGEDFKTIAKEIVDELSNDYD